MASVVRTLAGMAEVLRRAAVLALKGGLSGGRMPRRGEEAPGFSATATDGTSVTLERYAGRRHVVLFFFPKADTPG